MGLNGQLSIGELHGRVTFGSRATPTFVDDHTQFSNSPDAFFEVT